MPGQLGNSRHRRAPHDVRAAVLPPRRAEAGRRDRADHRAGPLRLPDDRQRGRRPDRSDVVATDRPDDRPADADDLPPPLHRRPAADRVRRPRRRGVVAAAAGRSSAPPCPTPAGDARPGDGPRGHDLPRPRRRRPRRRDAGHTARPRGASTTAPTTTDRRRRRRRPEQVGEASADAFSLGWFSDTAAFLQVALWGLALTAIAIGAWLLSRRVRRNWVGALVGIVPFALVLYFFFQNVNRLLPAAL